MLTIQPLLGLANRLRAIDSAVGLAPELDLPLRILWRRTHSMGVRYDDLFLRPEEASEIVEVDEWSALGRAVSWARKKARLDPLPDFDWREIEDFNVKKFDFDGLRGVPSLHIATFNRFYRHNRPYAWLKPVAAIVDRVEATTEGFNNTIGVHIRRDDNARSIKESPTELFVERLRAEIDRDEAATFFLATDDDEVERTMKSTFPGRIIIHPKRSRDRRTVEAIEDAAVDLLCLSSTKRLLASFFSSFSEVAAEIGVIEAEVVRLGPEKRFWW